MKISLKSPAGAADNVDEPSCALGRNSRGRRDEIFWRKPMDGITALAGAATDLATAGVNTDAQVKVLKSAIDQAGEQLLPLLEGLGENVDLMA
ncbi:MAG: hypothetical protein AAB229_08110 [Candidatus Hydrogenedentota bacterium]